MGALGEFLRDGAGKPRQAGVWDCCAFPAAWAIQCGHDDPMAAGGWRGRYADDLQGERLATDAGGLVALFAAQLEGVGLQRVEQAAAGDIGVVSILGREAGAIFTGERWAIVAPRGLAFVMLGADCVRGVWRARGHG